MYATLVGGLRPEKLEIPSIIERSDRTTNIQGKKECNPLLALVSFHRYSKMAVFWELRRARGESTLRAVCWRQILDPEARMTTDMHGFGSCIPLLPARLRTGSLLVSKKSHNAAHREITPCYTEQNGPSLGQDGHAQRQAYDPARCSAASFPNIETGSRRTEQIHVFFNVRLGATEGRFLEATA